MVVDYRRLNQTTKRSFFLVPRGDDANNRVAQAWFVSLLDAVWCFNHVRNTVERGGSAEAQDDYRIRCLSASLLAARPAQWTGDLSENDAPEFWN